MPKHQIEISDGSRANVLDFIKKKKEGSEPFTVLDVGGGVHSWCIDVVDAMVDMNIEHDKNIIVFQGDINQDDVWRDVTTYIEKHGKFDFCVCTHTIEDIRDPLFVCQQMEKVAKAGYIAVPSKYIELSRFEFGPKCHRGYIHHRWIYDISKDDGKLVGYPKLPVLEHMPDLDAIASMDPHKRDLSFYWEGDIGLELCNGDYMGPNAQAVVGYFYGLVGR